MVYLQSQMPADLFGIIYPRLTVKLVKVLLMLQVYGKTIMSISNDIYQHYSTLIIITNKECMLLATLILEYFLNQYPGIRILNLMDLIRNLAWISSSFGKPVIYVYDIAFYQTIQDYMKSTVVQIWIYDRVLKKRRQMTLRIPTGSKEDQYGYFCQLHSSELHSSERCICSFPYDR